MRRSRGHALVLLCLAALAVPAVAHAHASIKRSRPGPRQRLERSPTKVEIDFDQAVKVFPGGIRVYDARGRQFQQGVHLESGGHEIIAPVPRLPTGAYTVRWRALSGDGHVVSGLFTFGVRVDAPEPTQAYGASGPTTTENVLRWLYFVCLALLIGGIAFRLVVLPRAVPRTLDRAFWTIALLAVIGGVQIGLVAFMLRAEDALQLPFGRFLYGDLSPFADGTRFGIAFVATTLGFAVVAALVFLGWLVDRPRPFLWPALGLSLVLASGLSLSGHSAVDPPSSKWSELADWVHLSAASLWAGGLAMLLVTFLCAPELRRTAFAGFARRAPFVFALLLAAGIYLSVLRLPSAHDLWTTGYGHLLIVKLSLVAVALVWGAFHHFVLEPRLGLPSVQLKARGSLAGETMVGMAVLLIAAFLVNSRPPPRATPPPTQAIGASTHSRR
jgi:copper transport protein